MGLFDKSDKEIVTDQLVIKDNVFEYEGSFLQIKNISYVTVVKDRFMPNGTAVLMVLLGLFFQSVRMGTIGWMVFFMGLGYIGWQIYRYIQDGQYLLIQLNSGLTLKFPCKDERFLKRVLTVIKCNVNERVAQNIVIDFSHSIIKDSDINNRIVK